jgi:hypothetical protein
MSTDLITALGWEVLVVPDGVESVGGSCGADMM